ncbi:MAG TPA: hypothetical protein VGS19_02585 [Streptosporangiaceae bacterium]|nr:hypothetical protein [Streptosporangiaceae bacterium]
MFARYIRGRAVARGPAFIRPRHGAARLCRPRPAVLCVLAAPVTVLALAVGVVVGAPPASASTPATCHFLPLTLMNGWQSEQNVYDTGDPSYCVAGDGMVYLAGSLARTGGGSAEFAVLPLGARPASTSYLNTYTFDGAVGIVRIGTDGALSAYSGGAAQFTSLAGISFPSASRPMLPLTLQNGWQSAQAAWGTGDPSYYVGGGVVHLAGSLVLPGGCGGCGSPSFTVLPPAARPASEQDMDDVYSFNGAKAAFTVWPDGSAWANYGDATDFTSLAGLQYPAASAAEQQLTVLNGWGSGAGTASGIGPSYYNVGGLVCLDGTMHNSGAPNTEFAALPTLLAPTHTLYLIVEFDYDYPAVLQIQPDGGMYIWGGPPDFYTSSDVTNLQGICFQQGS